MFYFIESKYILFCNNYIVSDDDDNNNNNKDENNNVKNKINLIVSQ